MNNINYSKLYRAFMVAAGLLILSLNSSETFAAPVLPAGMPDGGCWADPMNNLSIKLSGASFNSGEPGNTESVSFETNPFYYPAWCYSTSGKFEAHYFKSEILKPKSDKNSDYFKLNDDVDFNITINLYSTNRASPFADVYIPGATSGGNKQGISEIDQGYIGNKGIINFRLRRVILGGALFFPGGIELANLYRYGYSNHPPSVPIYRLMTQQTIIPVKVECRINNGQVINVPFGNIDSARVTPAATTSIYQAKRALNYKCNTALTQDIKVSLAADPAGFSDAIKTSNPDIGVVMQYKSQTVKPNDGFKTRLVNGQGSDEVTFVVVGSGKKPATGPFTGSATLIINSL